jgi:multidrug efflux system outer membrane protein
VPAGLPAALLERRPDIRQAEQQLRAANAQVGVTMGDFLPKIGLTALFGGASPELSALTAPESRLWSVGVDASGPLFRPAFSKGNTARRAPSGTRPGCNISKPSSRHSMKSPASFTRGRNTRRPASSARSVAAYQDAVLVATERYRAGHANYFDILEAEQQLFPDENALARTQLNQLLIIVNLYKSLGGGWNQPETPAPAR